MRQSHIGLLSEEQSLDDERGKRSGSPALPVLTWPPVTLRDILASSTTANPHTSSRNHFQTTAEESPYCDAAISSNPDFGSWYFVPPDANRPEQTGRWIYNPATPSLFAERRTSGQYDEAVEKGLQDKVMEPRSDIRSHEGLNEPRLRKPGSLRRDSSEQVLEAMRRMTLDTVIESALEDSDARSDKVYEDSSPPGISVPLSKWTMPRSKIYRDAFFGSSSKLSDSDIESMMNSGELIEDSKGIRYASDTFPNPYILHNLGKGKKPEDSTNLKVDRVKEHSWRTLTRVNIEGEEVVDRAGSPIVDGYKEEDGDEEMAESSQIGTRGRKVVRFWAWKDMLSDDWGLQQEAVVDNERTKGEKARADWKGGKKRRRREEAKRGKEAVYNGNTENIMISLRE